jgi:hypothetical protein
MGETMALAGGDASLLIPLERQGNLVPTLRSPVIGLLRRVASVI